MLCAEKIQHSIAMRLEPAKLEFEIIAPRRIVAAAFE
jgi:hypothetical protein